MTITTRTARRWMTAGLAVVRRNTDDGTALADATAWTPDDTWTTMIESNGDRYYVIDCLDSQTTHHVRA